MIRNPPGHDDSDPVPGASQEQLSGAGGTMLVADEDEKDEGQRALECKHSAGGVCTIHGPGAKRKFKPVRVTTIGPDGLPVSKIKRKNYYKCYVGEGEERLRQTKISFGGLLDTRRGGRMDKQGSLGKTNAAERQGLD